MNIYDSSEIFQKRLTGEFSIQPKAKPIFLRENRDFTRICIYTFSKKENRKRAFSSAALHAGSVLLFLYIFRIDFPAFFRLFSGRIRNVDVSKLNLNKFFPPDERVRRQNEQLNYREICYRRGESGKSIFRHAFPAYIETRNVFGLRARRCESITWK